MKFIILFSVAKIELFNNKDQQGCWPKNKFEMAKSWEPQSFCSTLVLAVTDFQNHWLPTPNKDRERIESVKFLKNIYFSHSKCLSKCLSISCTWKVNQAYLSPTAHRTAVAVLNSNTGLYLVFIFFSGKIDLDHTWVAMLTGVRSMWNIPADKYAVNGNKIFFALYLINFKALCTKQLKNNMQ